MLNIFKQLNTENIVDGVVTIKRFEILEHYLKNDFVLELITLLTVFYNFPIFGSLSRLVVLFMLPRNSEILEKIKDIFILNRKVTTVLTISFLYAKILLLVFFVACSFHVIGWLELAHKEGWLEENHIEEKPFYTKFISSFQWALASMESRETALIVETDIEKTLTILVNLIGYLMLGVMIHSI